MKKIYPYKNIAWVDVENPTREEIIELMSQYNFSPRIAEELLMPTPRPKADVYEDYAYIVMHFSSVHDHGEIETRDELEVDCIITREALITVRYAPLDTMHEFGKSLEVTSLLGKDSEDNNGGFLFYHLMYRFYKDIEISLHNLESILKNVETKIFQGEEERMVRLLSQINRRILDHKRSLRFHGMTLGDLQNKAGNLFGNTFTFHLDRLGRTYHEIMAVLESDKQILDDLRDTNALLLTTKTNNIMKLISIIAFITVPVGIGLQFLKNQIENAITTPGGVAIVLSAIILFTLGLFWFFKYKRWI